MNGIQILLIGGVLLIFLYYLLNFRNAWADLAIVVLFAGAAIFFILYPDYTNTIAARLGVGRGADLLFYSCILFFLFVIIKLFARIRRLEQQLSDWVSRSAREGAREMDAKP